MILKSLVALSFILSGLMIILDIAGNQGALKAHMNLKSTMYNLKMELVKSTNCAATYAENLGICSTHSPNSYIMLYKNAGEPLSAVNNTGIVEGENRFNKSFRFNGFDILAKCTNDGIIVDLGKTTPDKKWVTNRLNGKKISFTELGKDFLTNEDLFCGSPSTDQQLVSGSNLKIAQVKAGAAVVFNINGYQSAVSVPVTGDGNKNFTFKFDGAVMSNGTIDGVIEARLLFTGPTPVPYKTLATLTVPDESASFTFSGAQNVVLPTGNYTADLVFVGSATNWQGGASVENVNLVVREL